MQMQKWVSVVAVACLLSACATGRMVKRTEESEPAAKPLWAIAKPEWASRFVTAVEAYHADAGNEDAVIAELTELEAGTELKRAKEAAGREACKISVLENTDLQYSEKCAAFAELEPYIED